jgi:hypothetical protein
MSEDHTVTGGRYDCNVGRLTADYSDFSVRGAADGSYRARLRTSRSTPRGPDLEATSLDELAEKMDAVRRRLDGV